MSYEDELANLAPFARLRRSELSKLASAVVERKYQMGDELVRVGEPAFALFIVKRGRVEISVPQGGGAVRRQELAAGSVFGEMAMLDTPEKRLGTVTAIEDTHCLLILRDHLTGLRPPL